MKRTEDATRRLEAALTRLEKSMEARSRANATTGDEGSKGRVGGDEAARLEAMLRAAREDAERLRRVNTIVSDRLEGVIGRLKGLSA